MLLYCGIELSHNNILAALISDDGKVLIKKTMLNHVEALIAFLESYRLQLSDLIMEAIKIGECLPVLG